MKSFKLFLLMTVSAMVMSVTMSFIVVNVSPPKDCWFEGVRIDKEEGGKGDMYSGVFTYSKGDYLVIFNKEEVLIKAKKSGKYSYEYCGTMWYLFEGQFETVFFDRDSPNRITLTNKICL